MVQRLSLTDLILLEQDQCFPGTTHSYFRPCSSSLLFCNYSCSCSNLKDSNDFIIFLPSISVFRSCSSLIAYLLDMQLINQFLSFYKLHLCLFHPESKISQHPVLSLEHLVVSLQLPISSLQIPSHTKDHGPIFLRRWGSD